MFAIPFSCKYREVPVISTRTFSYRVNSSSCFCFEMALHRFLIFRIFSNPPSWITPYFITACRRDILKGVKVFSAHIRWHIYLSLFGVKVGSFSGTRLVGEGSVLKSGEWTNHPLTLLGSARGERLVVYQKLQSIPQNICIEFMSTCGLPLGIISPLI